LEALDDVLSSASSMTSSSLIFVVFRKDGSRHVVAVLHEVLHHLQEGNLHRPDLLEGRHRTEGLNMARMIQLISFKETASTVLKDVIEGRREAVSDIQIFAVRRQLALMLAPRTALRVDKARLLKTGDHFSVAMAAEILLDTTWGKEIVGRLHSDESDSDLGCNGVLPPKKRRT